MMKPYSSRVNSFSFTDAERYSTPTVTPFFIHGATASAGQSARPDESGISLSQSIKNAGLLDFIVLVNSSLLYTMVFLLLISS